MTYLQLPDSFVNLVKEIHERFDIISFFEVLEHLDNPVRFIEHTSKRAPKTRWPYNPQCAKS